MQEPTKSELAKLAKSLLDSPAFDVVYKRRYLEIVEAWQASQTATEREIFHADIRALLRLKESIYAAANDRDAVPSPGRR